MVIVDKNLQKMSICRKLYTVVSMAVRKLRFFCPFKAAKKRWTEKFGVFVWINILYSRRSIHREDENPPPPPPSKWMP
jgi:hypothetical protein